VLQVLQVLQAPASAAEFVCWAAAAWTPLRSAYRTSVPRAQIGRREAARGGGRRPRPRAMALVTFAPFCAVALIVGPAYPPALRTPLASGPLSIPMKREAGLRMCAPAETAPEAPEPRPSPLRWFKRCFAFDRKKLAALGVDAMLTYGVVSNVNAALLVSFVWGSFSKAYGISPLSPGAWQKFLPFYFGICASRAEASDRARAALL
jgi:hypothetical protein